MVRKRIGDGSFHRILFGFAIAMMGCNEIAGIEEGIPDPSYCSGNCPTNEDGGDGSADSGTTCVGCVRCTAPWSFEDPSTQHCYRVVTTAAKWDAALKECRSFGADLSAINSQDELKLIGDSINGDVWTGGSDRAKDGTFVWSNGEAWTFTQWAPTRPTDKNDKHDCVKLTGNPPVFFDEVCSMELPYLCESVSSGL